VDGSQLGLIEGEEIALDDLLYMLMLKSANDAAETIAVGVAGSIEAFAELMNKKAKEIGCVSTNFVNPHGMPNDNHYTTAKELALITREALKNDTFKTIVGTHKKKLGYHSLVIENSNKLLNLYSYTDGVKTGFTKKAGRCLVTSATKDGVTLITVTLDAGDDWNDHIKLYEHNFSRIKAVELIPIGEYEASRPSLNGKSRTVVTNLQPLIGVEIDGKLPYYEYSENLPKFFFAPVQKMKVCGSLYLMYKNKPVAKSTLYCPEGVEQDESETGFWGLYIYYFTKIIEKVLF
jgi:D-alanyl-D-alanine carboxypeptidase